MAIMISCSSCVSLLVLGVVAANNLTKAQPSPLQSNDKNGKSCNLECPRNAPCRFGNADFSGRMDVLTVGVETHRNGMHCDCPIGWTGILCDRKFETCTNQNGHECYNGGECILGLQDKYGNEQLFCDCSNAIGYVGKYCETPFQQNCGGDVFCVNGGECNPAFPESSAQPCFCDEGWEGYHCEYKKNEIPECTLDCQNDGACFVGASGESDHAAQNHRSPLEGSGEHMSCRCLPGFGGRLCETTVEWCGSNKDHKCMNGGECVTTSVQTPDGDIRSRHYCNCTVATNGNDYFAGKFCEHKATSMCSNGDSNFFCTQGGTCKDNPSEGCSCRNGTSGPKCEFVLESSKQDDRAHNGSIGNINENEDDFENIDNSYNFNKDDYSWSSNNKEMIPCADGYCLNGGNCVTEQIVMQDGSLDTMEYCDCSQAYDASSNYAGPYCQYKSTSLCVVGDSLQGSLDETFCVHNGVCKQDGSCDCPSGWSGQYCELKTLNLDQNSVYDLITDVDTSEGYIEFDFEKCGESVCYNGGSCVETEHLQANGDLVLDTHCDCSTAFDDKYLYAGTSCEFPSTQICSIPQGGQDLGGSTFCTNHGNCMNNVRLGCDCPTGFFGFACEYESHDNGNNFKNAEENKIVDWEVCGQGVCYHGGKCITSIIYIEELGTSKTSHSCDCSTAYNDQTAYLGASCEYPSTDVCVPPKTGEPLSSAQFCVNHGTCQRDPYEDCDCNDGFEGQFCQFRTDLDQISKDVDGDGEENDFESCGDGFICLNGGKCTTTLDTGENGEIFEFRTCDCDSTINGVDIFAGVSCEHRATSLCTAPAKAMFCTNGGKCQQNDVCDCELPWKGIHCELPVDPKDIPTFPDNGIDDVVDDNQSLIDVCTTGDEYPGQPLYFCVNGGSCNALVTGDEPDPGCTCPDSYTGPHCEVNIEITGKSSSAVEAKRMSLIAGVMFTLLGTTALIAVRFWRSRMTTKNGTITTGECVPVTKTPFSPRRRRRAGFGGSPNWESSDSISSAPSSSLDASAITLGGCVDQNEGIMNEHPAGDEKPHGKKQVLVENTWQDDGSKLEASHFV